MTESAKEFSIKDKRRVYLRHEKETVVKLYDAHLVKKDAMTLINSFVGYEKISYKTINDFRISLAAEGVNKRLGRPVCKDFETEVLNECVIYKLVVDSKDIEQFQVITCLFFVK